MANSVTEYICESTLKAIPGHGPGVGRQLVRGLIEAKKFTPDQIHLTELAKGCFGTAWESRLQTVSARRGQWVGEATEAVDLTAWRGILGAVTTERMEAGYQQATSPVEDLVGVWESQQDDVNNELLVPYPSAATDPSRDVAPGTEYPKTNFTQYSIRVPVPVKHGLIAQLTLETARANRKRQFLDALFETGRVVGLEMVRRKLRLLLGITQNYTVVTANGTATTTATYVTTAGRLNLITDLNLANGPKELDRLLQVFANMSHPLTGEPIDLEVSAMFTTRGNAYTLANATGVQQIRTTTSGVEYVGPNPVSFDGPIVTDVRAQRLLTSEAGIEAGAMSAAEAATFTAIGDFKAALKWREADPFRTFEAGPGDQNESADRTWAPDFYQDIVYACKARWWGCGFVYDPYRLMAAYKSDS